MIITTDPIDVTTLAGTGPAEASGAQVVFKGVVRDHNDGRRVCGIYYDCYEEMAELEIRNIVREVSEQGRVGPITVVHRVGELEVGDTSLLVVVEAPHRREAFAVTMRVVDEIKARVPIWKKERYVDERERWL